jgi:hypothetical protein
MTELAKDGRHVNIEEAKRLSKTTDILIFWRPEGNLREEDQYALVYGD